MFVCMHVRVCDKNHRLTCVRTETVKYMFNWQRIVPFIIAHNNGLLLSVIYVRLWLQFIACSVALCLWSHLFDLPSPESMAVNIVTWDVHNGIRIILEQGDGLRKERYTKVGFYKHPESQQLVNNYLFSAEFVGPCSYYATSYAIHIIGTGTPLVVLREVEALLTQVNNQLPVGVNTKCIRGQDRDTITWECPDRVASYQLMR